MGFPDEPVLAALQRFLRRLPGGEVRSHSVGESNALQGHAVYLDYPGGHCKLRLLLLFLARGDSWAYHHALQWAPSRDYGMSPSLSGPDFVPPLPRDWDKELTRFESRLRQLLSRPRPAWTTEDLPPLPEDDYPILSAALQQRMQSRKLTRFFVSPELSQGPTEWEHLQAWCPLLSAQSAKQHEQRDQYRLDPGELGAISAADDILDLYREHPQAHGCITLSAPGYRADGQQGVLTISHDVGFWPYVAGDWQGPEPTRPEGARLEPFREALVMERLDGQWKLAARLDVGLPAPPWEREARVRRRLQAELGSWASVEKLEFVERRLSQVWIGRPEGVWRVVSGRELGFDGKTRIFLEPSLWIPDGYLTGPAIREAYERRLS